MLDTAKEVSFERDELIVSKTNTKGIITYANETFMRVSGYNADEIIGKPHNIIRHPFMPKTIFKLLWDTIQDGQEIFAYVVNRTKNGGHYWVLAHVTPSIDTSGTFLGYHSNRRVPDRQILNNHIIPLYKKLNEIEQQAATKRDGLEKAHQHLIKDVIGTKATDYHQFILTLEG